MTDSERLIVSAYTGILMCDMGKFQAHIERLLGRQVWTHELGMPDVWEEIKGKSRGAFLKLCE